MAEHWQIVIVVAAIFLATVFRSAFGFGEALLAVPIMSLIIPVEQAVPLATLISITVAAVIVAQDWHKIHVRSAGWLVVSTIFGIPLGLLLLKFGPEKTVKAILGVVIIVFSTYCLSIRNPRELKDDRFAWLFGFGAGILGGAYAINGPPLVVYGSLRRWTPEHFRATLQGYFFPASLLGLIGYALADLWTPAVTRYYLWSLLPAIAAILLGRAINRRLKHRSFLRYIHFILILIGISLLLGSLLARNR